MAICVNPFVLFVIGGFVVKCRIYRLPYIHVSIECG